ncbi:MAG: SIMPL domain-containing protein [Candidatus Falkowbacteria bacterium]|nr:SIMPL domain-containing protein [Candidatus Falkowbacteria bacterium]
MESKNLNNVWPLIIGLSLIISSAIGGYAFYQGKALATNTLSVTGSAEKIVTSDTVKWSSNFSRNVDASGLKGGSAQMKNDLQILKDYFKKNGVADSELTVNPMTISPLCESQNNVMYDKFGNQTCGNNKTAGYTLQQTVIIESEKVKEITDLSKNAGNYLIDQGLIFSSQGTEYYFNKLADIKIDLIDQATKNAKERADKIAASTGATICGLQSASTGVIQVTTKNSADVSDYGYYDTSSIEKKVTAVVKASFTLR